ncbi:hypothetical protein D3C77_341410 [compost metagenome]
MALHSLVQIDRTCDLWRQDPADRLGVQPYQQPIFDNPGQMHHPHERLPLARHMTHQRLDIGNVRQITLEQMDIQALLVQASGLLDQRLRWSPPPHQGDATRTALDQAVQHRLTGVCEATGDQVATLRLYRERSGRFKRSAFRHLRENQPPLDPQQVVSRRRLVQKRHQSIQVALRRRQWRRQVDCLAADRWKLRGNHPQHRECRCGQQMLRPGLRIVSRKRHHTETRLIDTSRFDSLAQTAHLLKLLSNCRRPVRYFTWRAHQGVDPLHGRSTRSGRRRNLLSRLLKPGGQQVCQRIITNQHMA